MEPDWSSVEHDYWRQRLLALLERRAVVRAFVTLTREAPPAPFVFDVQTRCMRRAG